MPLGRELAEKAQARRKIAPVPALKLIVWKKEQNQFQNIFIHNKHSAPTIYQSVERCTSK
ncbi:MAG: hypothetical protein GY820_47060 [Gammaproteobacteria bacterium]|nr:hypothetical protein [Gammaproteobacteria bacterium]